MVRDISKLIAFAQLPVNTKAEVLWSAAPFAFLDVSVLKRGQFYVGKNSAREWHLLLPLP